MKPQVPWLRVFAEGVAIVVSILLAFGIQAWWEERQDRAEEERILVALSDEFAANREVLATNRTSHEAQQQAALTLLRAAASEIAMPMDSVDYLLSDIIWYGTDGWVTGTMDALLSSGDIGLISNKSLQLSLASWPDLRERLAAVEAEDEHGYEVLLPYLVSKAYLPQLYNATRGIPGVSREVPHSNVSLPIAGGGLDHTLLLGDREFQNLVSMRYTNETDYESVLGDMEALINEIRALLEAEIAR